ncbi:MAG: CdaR family protein [Eubacteriales bacterium]|nr:CdaR family protein [Eubacteriales bacterium]
MPRNKLYSFLLSLVIAFGLWLYVVNNVSQEDSTTISGIPVIWEGEAVLNDNNLMLTHVSAETVSLHVSGARSELSKINAGNIFIKCDISKINEPGEKIPLLYTYAFPGDVPSNALQVESRNPGVLYVNVDYRRTKEVNVAVKWTGTRSEDYLYDTENAKLDYNTVTVVGPAAVADQITQAVIEVDLSQRTESISESFRYTLCNADGEPVDAEQIVTNVEEIRMDMSIQRIKDLNLAVDVIYGGGATPNNTSVKLAMESIRVSGSAAALDALGDTLTVCSINLAEVERSREDTYPIVLPEGVTNQTGVGEVLVSIRFSGLRTKEFTVENIQSVNVPEGMAAEIIGANLTVKVRGSEAEINALTAEDITAVVDFTDAVAGTATYKASISFSDSFKNVGALKTSAVSATVRPAEG